MFWFVLPALAFDAAPKIINGGAAPEDVYPAAGGMLVDVQGAKYLVCSSTLIAPDVIMVAAHCIDPSVIGAEIEGVGWSRQADLNAWKAGSGDWPDDAVVAADWVYHPDWSYASLGEALALNHDIGLVFLEEEAPDGVLAYLPTPDEATQIVEGSVVDIVGWGMTDANDTDSYGTKNWGTSSIDALADYEFQVGVDTEDVRKCHGDSGGPSFMEVDSEASVDVRVIGVTSHAWDATDCTQTGGVDTRVDYYLSWIDTELRERCEDGSRAWCATPGILPPPIPMTDAELRAGVALVGCATGGRASAVGVLAALGLLTLRRRR